MTHRAGPLLATALPTGDDDWHFPAEEPEQLAEAQQIFVDELDAIAGTVSISSQGGAKFTLAVGGASWTPFDLRGCDERVSQHS